VASFARGDLIHRFSEVRPEPQHGRADRKVKRYLYGVRLGALAAPSLARRD
jgi:hypothetical protein